MCHESTSQHSHHEEHLQMIGRAARMSAVFVNKNARVEEGWFQVHWRLLWHATKKELTKEFVERMEKCAPRPWVMASSELLEQAGSNAQVVVNLSGVVWCTHEDGGAIWILSEVYGIMFVGRYNKLNESYKEVELEMCESSNVECASFLRDHRKAVTAHRERRIWVWNTDTGVCEKVIAFSKRALRPAGRSLHPQTALQRLIDACLPRICENYRFVEFSEQGSVVACELEDHSIVMLDAMSGKTLGSPLRGDTDWVRCVAVSADGTRILSGSLDNTVRVWDAQSGSAVGEPLRGHTDWVTCVALSADGTRIVSGSEDCTVRVWDAQSGSAVEEPLRSHTGGVRYVGVNADGSRVVLQDWNMVRLWAITAAGCECALTSRNAAWHRTFDALELTWSGTEVVSH